MIDGLYVPGRRSQSEQAYVMRLDGGTITPPPPKTPGPSASQASMIAVLLNPNSPDIGARSAGVQEAARSVGQQVHVLHARTDWDQRPDRRTRRALHGRSRFGHDAPALLVRCGKGRSGVWASGGPLILRACRPADRRTVSSRTPNASEMRGLVQPDSVSNTALTR